MKELSDRSLITIIRICTIVVIAGLFCLATITANIVRQELEIEEIRKKLDEWEENEVLIENSFWNEKYSRN